MKRLSRTQGILVFYFFDLALLLLLVLSFLPFMHKKQIRTQDMLLLNPSVSEKICFIDLSQKDEDSFFSRRRVSLMKKGGVWLGSSSDGNDEYIWPADIQSVEKLISCVASVSKLYEKASSRKDWDAFGLKEKDAFSLSFYDASHTQLSLLYFGKEDALTNRVYIRSSADDRVYELDGGITAFLSVEESFWADPFLYPLCLTGLERNEAELMLRRGKIENIRPREGLPVDYEERLSFGNGASILFSIYRKDSSYIVIPSLKPGPAVSEEERLAISTINYRYSISGTTLEKLLEECSLSE